MNSVENIWKTYNNQLKNFIKRRISNEQDVEDILHEVFIKISIRIEQLEDENKIQGWIYTITRNQINDYYRKHDILLSLPADEIIDENNSENLNSDMTVCLKKMIYKLPSKYKQAIVLSELHNISQKELATQTGLSLSGAKSRVQRGRHKLKKMLLDCCDVQHDKYGNIVDFTRK